MNTKQEHASIWTVIASEVDYETIFALKNIIVWYMYIFAFRLNFSYLDEIVGEWLMFF